MLQLAEEFEDEGVATAICRSLKLIFKSDAAYDRICEKYPSMGEFLSQLVSADYNQSQGVVAEGLMALDVLLRRPHYIRLIGAHWHNQILALKSMPKHQA